MRLQRHPLPPMLVHFPIAFWSLASVCDGLLMLGSTQASTYAWMAIAVASAMAVPAMINGALDIARLSNAAEADGRRHMMLMALAWTDPDVFALIWNPQD